MQNHQGSTGLHQNPGKSTNCEQMPPIRPGTGLPSQSVRDHGAPPTQNPAMPTLSFAIQEQYNSHSKPNNPHRPTKIHHIFTRTPSSSVSDSPSRSRSHQPNPTQSTILTQSTCNLGIPLQSENGWARDYRTRDTTPPLSRPQTEYFQSSRNHRDPNPPEGSINRCTTSHRRPRPAHAHAQPNLCNPYAIHNQTAILLQS